MKKFLSILFLILFFLSNYSAYANSDLNDYYSKNKSYFETQILNNSWWEKFIKLIENFIEKHWKNKEKINELIDKIWKIDITKIKKIDTQNKLMYLNAILNISLNKINIEDNINVSSYEKLSITVYDDKRCTNCPTQEVIDQLKLLPSIQWVEIVKKDFSDAWVEKYLQDNQVTALPLIVFSTNNFDVSLDEWPDNAKINNYLVQLPSNEYSLSIWANFDPFIKRSAKWFLLLEKDKLQKIKDSSYIKWNKNAKITWIEYSDLQCPFCAKLHNDWTVKDIQNKYGDKLNIIFNHFPLVFHENAQIWAEALECATEQKWADVFYKLIDKIYEDTMSSKSYIIEQAVSLWVNKTNLEKCINDSKYTQKVKDQMKVWTEIFAITWTPWNVLINNETWEYEIISWAYPTSEFEKVIDGLLK